MGRELERLKRRNTILTNFPSWNRLVAYAEWTEFCEIDQMKKMNVFILFIYFLCNNFHSADSEE